MALHPVSVGELRSLKASGQLKDAPLAATPAELTNMLMPIKTNENHVLEIMTRQSFLDSNIKLWREWHLYRAGAIVLAVAALYLLTVNVLLSVVAAGLSAYVYGLYYHRDFIIQHPLKKRDLYEVG